MQEHYLTILEVSQKQAYIFQSNELRSNILHSAVIAWIMSGEYLEEAVQDKQLFCIQKNLVYAGGGHIVLEFDSQSQAEEFAQKVTWAIRKDYPGVEIFAALREYDEKLTPGENMKELTKKLEKKKAVRLSSFHQGSFGVEKINTNTRTPMLEGETPENLAKAKMPQAEEKVDKGLSVEGFHRVYQFGELGGSKNESNFIAVVHIDGNAMGKRVEKLREEYGHLEWNVFKEKMNQFSKSIDSQFKAAYKEMAEYVAQNIRSGRLSKLDLQNHNLPVRRIITAGDDICFVSEGRIGLECAAAFIHALEKKKNDVDGQGYAACAGVAIVHQKYPFYKAYELAELLCSNAKKFGASLSADGSGREVSAIDWHIEYGEVKDTLEEIRMDYVDRDNRSLVQRPYIVSAPKEILEKEPVRQYANFRKLEQEIQQEESFAKGRMKELRPVLKQGRQETEYYLKFHKITEILDESKNGRFEMLFDAVELMDTFLPLESEGCN